MKIPKRKAVKAWHFLKSNRLPGHGNITQTPIEVGTILHVVPPLNIRNKGLHASIRVIDALRFAPGPIVCRVRVWGEMESESDKVCAEYREVIAMEDATNVLFEFACQAAERALLGEREAGREPHADSWAAIDARRKWLRKEIADDQLSAACSAAFRAADCAPCSAACSAAYSAADCAACSAADSEAYSAAYSAADSAADSAAFSAACSAADSAADSAAFSAAYSAAYRAEREAQDGLLLEHLSQLLGLRERKPRKALS